MNDTHGETGKGRYGFDLDGTLAKEEAMTKKEDQAMSDRTECPFAEHRTNPLGQERVYCRCPGAKPTPMATADFCEFGLLPCSRYEDYMTGRAQQNADAAAAVDDTHGVEGKGWYGFDLDGTLAKYDGWEGIDHIGEPVKPMVELIKRMHDEGKVVKIMTARVAPHKLEDGTVGESYITIPGGEKGATRNYAHQFINDWCHFNLGFIPEIVYQKDHLMLELYDDRVKQVVPNEGWLVEDIAMSKRRHTETTIVKREFIDVRWWERVNCFLFGMMVMTAIVVAAQMYLSATTTVPEAERKPRDAASEYMQSKINERVEGLLK